MLRLIAFIAAAGLSSGVAGGAWAQTVSSQIEPEHVADTGEASTVSNTEAIWDALRIAEMMPILRDEALQQADLVAEIMFQRDGAGRWREVVSGIHDPDRMQKVFRDGLTSALEDRSVAEVDQAIAFYATDLGQRLAQIELSARQAMLSEGTEEEAKAAFKAAEERDDPRVSQIRRLIETANLVEPNIAGAMNAAFAFSQGLSQGNGYQMPMTESQLLADVASQEPEIRAETVEWLEAYLFLAYSAISDEELTQYTEFSSSRPGQTLAEVLFQAFDKVFRRAAQDMGIAAAAQLEARSL